MRAAYHPLRHTPRYLEGLCIPQGGRKSPFVDDLHSDVGCPVLADYSQTGAPVAAAAAAIATIECAADKRSLKEPVGSESDRSSASIEG